MKLTAKLLVPILAVSLSLTARAITITSAANGDWSLPASWDSAPAPAPDTYAGTDNVLIEGFTINYNAGISTPGGGFAIANGRNVTIGGTVAGTLTQTLLTEVMRVGEGLGGGTGSLTIDVGSTLDTGAAFGLAVGSKISGATFGDGLLDIKEGLLKLGAGASVSGLGVGIDGSDGILNVGDTFGAAGTSIVNLSTNNIQMFVGSGTLGGVTGGAVNINSDGIINFGTGNINIGLGGGKGAMTISSGGSLVGGSGAILIGQGAGSTGTLLNSGTISGTGEVRIGGGGGAGTFTMTGGAVGVTNEFSVGRGASSSGTLTFSGGTLSANSTFIGREGGTGMATVSGGTVTANGQLFVGTNGGSTGTLTISTAGTVVAATDFTKIGNDNGTGTLTMSGGALNTTNYMTVGQDGGVGTVNQTGGTVTFSQWAAIGVGGGANTSKWNVSGGNITSGAGIEVGADRGGEMNISGTANVAVGTVILGTRTNGNGLVNKTGGTLVTNNLGIAGAQSGGAFGTFNLSGGAGSVTTINGGGGQSYIGNNTGSVGTLNIQGAGTVLNNVSGQDHQIGFNGGTGNLNITAGGTMNHNWWINVARGGTSTGQITVDGAGSTLAQTAGQLNVGEDGTGTLSVTNGGTLNTADEFSIARNGGSNGAVTLAGAASTMNLLGHLFVGRSGTGTFTQTEGTLNLNNRRIQIGENGGSTGTFNITGGTVNNSEWFHVGSGAGSTGNLNVNFTNPAAVINTGALYVGNNSATGFATVLNGSLRANGVVEIGRQGNGQGTLTVTGPNSSVHAFTGGAGDFFRVGMASGDGIVNVTAGGKINANAGWFTLGENNGSNGTATFSGTGSSLTSNGLIVGWNGAAVGTLNITSNATVTSTGREVSVGRDNGGANSPTGIINVTTGGLLTGRDLRLGHNAVGIVNINSGGTVTSSAGWAIIGDGGASNGTVNMTNGNFNVTGDNLFIGANPGAVGTFTQAGASTTIVGNELNLGRNGGTAALNVNGGVFQVNGWTTIGRDGNNGTGVINVTNGGEFRHQTGNNGDFLLGWTNGSSGAVNVNTGGTVNYSWWTRVAVDGGSTGAITVDGATSNWNNTGGRVFIGESGTGTLNITNGGKFTMTNADWFVAGGNDGANSKGNGVVNISGAGSSLTSNNFLAFGRGRVDAANLATGTLNMTSGSISSSGSWIGFGTDQGRGTANISGTATGSSAGETIIGRTPNSIGTFNLSGSAVWTTGGEFQVGNNGGVGVANISGGTLNLLGYMAIGRNTNENGGLNGGNGTVNLSGTGVINKVNGNGTFDVGSWNGGNNATVNTTGTLTQTGGTVNNTVSDTHIGRDTGVVGIWNMSAGTANLARLNVGNAGIGSLNIGGGVLSADNVFVAQGGGSTGTINAVGGVIFTNTINIVTGGGTANFGGGTFRAKSDTYNPFVNFTAGNSELNAGGVIVDTNGRAISWSNTFDGVGGVSKTGNGNLLVPAQAPAFTGNHTVNQGTLTINETSSLGVGNVVINGGRVVLAPMGLSEGRIAGNSFDTVTANPGGAYRISQDRANSTDAAAFIDNSTWVYTGKFLVGGNSNVTWTFAEQFDDGVYLTVDGNAGIINDNSWNNPTKATVVLTPGVHTFEVRLGQGGGGVGPNNGWAVGFGYDPQGRDTLDPAFFQPFSDATGVFQFHDFVGTTTLANNVTLNAASSEVNVPVAGMTSAITGLVSGGGGLTKTGSGVLALTNANSYNGGTVIDGGTLKINANAALGALAGGVAINNNAILQATANVTTNRTVTLGTGGGQIDANGKIVTLDTLSTLTGTSLTSDDTAGSGVVNIKGTQTYSALTTKGLGVTNMYTALGTGTSTITANATLNIYASQTLGSLSIGAGTEVTFGDGLPFTSLPAKIGGGAAGVVPEPGSLGLLLVGALGFIARRRRSC